MLSKFAGLLNIEQPSTFDGSKETSLDAVMNVAVFPVTADTTHFGNVDSAGPWQLSWRGGDRAEESFAETFGQGDSRSSRPGAPADPGRRRSRRTIATSPSPPTPMRMCRSIPRSCSPSIRKFRTTRTTSSGRKKSPGRCGRWSMTRSRKRLASRRSTRSILRSLPIRLATR